jgi:hypothetical protein
VNTEPRRWWSMAVNRLGALTWTRVGGFREIKDRYTRNVLWIYPKGHEIYVFQCCLFVFPISTDFVIANDIEPYSNLFPSLACMDRLKSDLWSPHRENRENPTKQRTGTGINHSLNCRRHSYREIDLAFSVPGVEATVLIPHRTLATPWSQTRPLSHSILIHTFITVWGQEPTDLRVPPKVSCYPNTDYGKWPAKCNILVGFGS